VSPDDVRKLRDELRCSVTDLARALELETATVIDWEMGEKYPTKKHVGMMEALRKRGADAFPRPRRAKPDPTLMGVQRLADPKLWELVRKLCAHPQLFDEATRLAEKFDDPK